MAKNLKTENNPEGRSWPDEIVLDVGSNMPLDVYGVCGDKDGVRYVRHDVAEKRMQTVVHERDFLRAKLRSWKDALKWVLE
jgi:hypothetical protein